MKTIFLIAGFIWWLCEWLWDKLRNRLKTLAMNDTDSTRWKIIYSNNNKVRRLADRIHDSRMLPPPTCDQCIEIAVNQLKEVHARNRLARKTDANG